jgi:hypothetical protein
VEQKKKGKEEKRSRFAKEVQETIEWWKERIKSEEKYNCPDQTEMRMKKFMHHYWKKLSYTAMIDRAVLEHQDCERYAREFVSRSELCGPCCEPSFYCRSRWQNGQKATRFFWCRPGRRTKMVDAQLWVGDII